MTWRCSWPPVRRPLNSGNCVKNDIFNRKQFNDFPAVILLRLAWRRKARTPCRNDWSSATGLVSTFGTTNGVRKLDRMADVVKDFADFGGEGGGRKGLGDEEDAVVQHALMNHGVRSVAGHV